MADEELQQLMRQVIQSRKLEKDYKNIEDQIRCLKLRMFQQTQTEVKLRHEHTDVNEQIASQTEDLMIEHEALDRRRVNLEQRYQQQKHEYIRLNNLEGELHSQIASLRGSTSDQMMQNKQLEARVSAETAVA